MGVLDGCWLRRIGKLEAICGTQDDTHRSRTNNDGTRGIVATSSRVQMSLLSLANVRLQRKQPRPQRSSDLHGTAAVRTRSGKFVSGNSHYDTFAYDHPTAPPPLRIKFASPQRKQPRPSNFPNSTSTNIRPAPAPPPTRDFLLRLFAFPATTFLPLSPSANPPYSQWRAPASTSARRPPSSQ